MNGKERNDFCCCCCLLLSVNLFNNFYELEFLIDIFRFFWVVKCLINITRCNSITRSSLYILSNGLPLNGCIEEDFFKFSEDELFLSISENIYWTNGQTKKYLSMAVSYVCWPIYSLWIAGASWHWLQFT